MFLRSFDHFCKEIRVTCITTVFCGDWMVFIYIMLNVGKLKPQRYAMVVCHISLHLIFINLLFFTVTWCLLDTLGS